MALDVLRHRLVLSYEALSDNVTSDDLLTTILDRIPSRSCRSVSMPTSASTPERILQRLDWQVIRRLDGLLQGDYRSLFYGYGVDFADLREYQPGDDVRYIDWNVTARMDTPYVRQYVEDREITAWFLLDLSPSVDFGTPTRSAQAERADRLRDDAGPAADAPRQPGRGDLLRQPRRARRSRRAAAASRCCGSINDLLRAAAPAERAVHRPRAAARGGPHAIKRRSLVFVISDFISAPGLGAAAQPAQPAARGPGRPPVRPARDRAARRRAAASWRTPRPASSSTSTPTTGLPAAVREAAAGARGRR